MKGGLEQGAKEGFNEAKYGQIADEIGDMRTEEWAKNHEGSFKEQAIKNGATPEEADTMWNSKLTNQRKAMRKLGRQGFANGDVGQSDMVDAKELAARTADNLNDSYRKTNKDQYIKDKMANGYSPEEAEGA